MNLKNIINCLSFSKFYRAGSARQDKKGDQAAEGLLETITRLLKLNSRLTAARYCRLQGHRISSGYLTGGTVFLKNSLHRIEYNKIRANTSGDCNPGVSMQNVLLVSCPRDEIFHRDVKNISEQKCDENQSQIDGNSLEDGLELFIWNVYLKFCRHTAST